MTRTPITFAFFAVLSITVIALSGCHSRAAAPSARPNQQAARIQPRGGVFENVAAKSGINFTLDNGETGDYRLVSTTSAGCAFLDYDRDGRMDVFLVQAGETPDHPETAPRPPCKLYRNRGDGRFEDVSGPSGIAQVRQGYAIGVAVGDYDNDGFPDIYLTGCGGNHLLHNDGHGGFVDVTNQAGVGDRDKGLRWATGAAWGDYDRDGKLDLIVGHYVPWSPTSEKKCTNSRGQRTYCSPEVYDYTEGLRLYHNDGNGQFTDVTEKTGLSKVRGRCLGVVWMDYDQDGWPDAYVACDISPNLLLHNRGGKRFDEVGLSVGVAYGADAAVLSGMGISAADYDRSGWESLVVSNFSGQPYSLYHAAGGGAFEDRTYQSGVGEATLNYLAFGIEFMDFDNDGWPDIVCGNGHIDPFIADIAPNTTYKERKSLLRNLGNGQFQDRPDLLGDMVDERVTRGLAVGDIDNDGRLDVLDNSQNMPAALYHNTAKGGHFVTVRLEGTRSNRDGAGALVWLTVGAKRAVAEARDGSSYASTSDPRIHFGVGTTTKADVMEVHWPSGLKQRFTGVDTDRFYVLREGEPLARDPRVK